MFLWAIRCTNEHVLEVACQPLFESSQTSSERSDLIQAFMSSGRGPEERRKTRFWLGILTSVCFVFFFCEKTKTSRIFLPRKFSNLVIIFIPGFICAEKFWYHLSTIRNPSRRSDPTLSFPRSNKAVTLHVTHSKTHQSQSWSPQSIVVNRRSPWTNWTRFRGDVTQSVMKFRIVRFILGIIGLIVIIQVLTTIHFSSTHWPDEHPVIGSRHVGRAHWKTRSHVENGQVRFARFIWSTLAKISAYVLLEPSFISVSSMLFSCKSYNSFNELAILVRLFVVKNRARNISFIISWAISKYCSTFTCVILAVFLSQIWLKLSKFKLCERMLIRFKTYKNPFSGLLLRDIFCKAASLVCE